ncbi:MAG: LLM class flavin-dependent oxidoreductase [Chloroflexi bacterium]|nr:MAG: LLM class flavin-dependent oxidoreductase [Chloroflexota bacterium]
MRIGLDVAQHQLLWPELAERVQFAESAGFDGAWVFDHFTPLYGDRNGPCMEAWTLLAGLAALTSRLRLGVLVTGITYRPPSILATEAITVDHISNGRLELGLGAAWHQPEHEELGIPFPPLKERAERLEEGAQVIRLVMTKDRASPADLDRCRRRAADVADRRSPGRRLACLRLRRFAGPQVTTPRSAGGKGRT